MLRQHAVEWPPALEKLRLPLQIPFISITEAMIAIITHAEEERERARGAVDSSLQ